MISVKRNVTGNPTADQLESFKAFASVNGAATDASLQEMLRRAMAEVQEWEDRTLLETDFSLTVTDREDPAAPVTLYGNPATVTAVDAAGEAVDGKVLGRQFFPARPACALTITYTATPDASDVADLAAKVYRYATALYDGESPQTLNRILQER